MPDPFLSYLRVYEPLRVFDGPAGQAVRDAFARGPLAPEQVGARERELCLRAIVRSRPLPAGTVDVLALTDVAGEPLICPLDTLPRAAAGLLAFLADEEPAVRAAAVPGPLPAARRTAEAALAGIGDGAAHVVTATWTVPLPWFALVDADDRRLSLAPRRVHWQVSIGTALARAERAEKIVRDTLGEEGPAEVLAETAAWLRRFDRGSVVELDYGGLVTLVPDDDLRRDESAALVQEALQALAADDGDTAQDCYARLREFWGAVAEHRGDG